MLHNYKINLEQIPPIAQTIADEFSNCPQVVAVALAGSRTTRVSDESSDFDFYLYVNEEISVEIREEIAKKFADCVEINNQFWEPGDEWIEASTRCSIDIMYRTPQWIESQLDRLLVQHQASVGYSTCFWWNILTSVSLYDRDGWFQQLQAKADQPYPPQLRQEIVAKNYPILRRNISGYRHQLESAVLRSDSVSIIHRISALLGSYFDIIFAINSLPHPGEKRLGEWAKSLCAKLPQHFDRDIHSITHAISSPAGDREILAAIDTLIDNLDELLIRENLSD